jgi:VanZ family protein
MLPLEGRWRRVACAVWRWSLPLAIGVAFCYGMFDEWHQGWVAGRTASMDDVIWDVIGGAAGAMAVLVLRSMFVRNGWLRRWVVAA